MARVKRAVHGKKHRRTVLERAQGFYGNKSRSYRSANEQVMHSLQYAYRDRRARKGDFRQAVDPADQRCSSAERHDLQPVHRRPPPRRHRSRPPHPGRPGRPGPGRLCDPGAPRRRGRRAPAAATPPLKRQPSWRRPPRQPARRKRARPARMRRPTPTARTPLRRLLPEPRAASASGTSASSGCAGSSAGRAPARLTASSSPRAPRSSASLCSRAA